MARPHELGKHSSRRAADQAVSQTDGSPTQISTLTGSLYLDLVLEEAQAMTSISVEAAYEEGPEGH